MRKGQVVINANDIIGKQSGKLVVSKYIGYVYTNSKVGLKMRHYYICDCDCGRMNIVERGPLLNGRTCSCGCLKGNKRKMGVNKVGYKNEKQQ